jgi:hypothetical protein
VTLPPDILTVGRDEYLAQLGASLPPADPNPFLNALPLNEFLAREIVQQPWIVDELISVGGMAMLYGKPKAGKSCLGRDLAFCIATGEPFLGRKTQKGRVLYLALEESPIDLHQKWSRMAVPAECAANLHLYTDGPVKRTDAIANLEEAVLQFDPTVIMIDTLFRFIKIGDENSYSQSTEAMDPLLKIARERNIAMIGLHHERKMGGDNGDGMLGSTGFFGSVDVAIKVDKAADGTRYVSSDHRMGTPLSKSALNMEPETGRLAIGRTSDELSITAMIDRIVAVLARHGGAMTRSELEQAAGGNKNVFTMAIRNLPASRVKKLGSGKRGDPYIYELAEASLLPSSI